MTKRNRNRVCPGSAAGALLACLAATASAQSTVQIYGVADTGVEYLNRVQDAQGRSSSSTRMPTVTAGQMPSRLGFRGTEDLGQGLKAVYVIESGLTLKDGSNMQSGRGWGRQAYVGLSGSWGALTLGRQYTMGLYAMIGSDLMGPAVYGLGSLNPYIPNQRIDSAVVYRGTFGAWQVGGLYSNGRDGHAPSNCGNASGATSGCEAYSAMLKYDNRQWGVTLAHDRLKGTEGAAFFGQPAGVTVGDGSRDDHTYLTGFAMLGKSRLGAGVVRRELKAVNETYRSKQYWLAVSHPLTQALVLDATVTWLDANRADADAQLFSVRGSYNFSKRTAVYALAGLVRNDALVGYSVSGGTAAPASPGLGRNQTGFMVGIRHSF